MALALTDIGKAYGPRRVLCAVSLEARGGEVITVTGANGSGKSTLLRIVAGLLRPSRGAVTLVVAGQTLDTAARRQAVGYASPDLALYPELSGRENLQFFVAVRGGWLALDAAETRLAAVGLGGRGEDPVSAYSSGMRQRLRLAFAMLAEPMLLLLDEPSATLDEDGVALVGEMVAAHRASGGLTLLATNDPREARLGERSIVLGA